MVVLDFTDFHYMDKNSLNIFQNMYMSSEEESYTCLEQHESE